MDVHAREAAVRAALARMEDASTALDDAAEDADTDALQRDYDAAKAEHGKATDALERAKAVAEARDSAPVEVVEEETDPEAEERTAPDADRSPKVRVKREPLTYERHNQHEANIFRDMAEARFTGNATAQARLDAHAREMEVEMQERANPSQAAGEGGEFIAPVWLQDEYLSVPRAGRAVADSLNPRPLPPNTNQINLPKVASGSSVAVQTDAGSVSSTDITSGSVTGQVQTVAGQQDASMQLHELSGPGIQEVIFDDISGAYDVALDTAVLSGEVTNAKGLLKVAGTNTVTFTQATPTLPLLYPKVADGIQQINTGRFLPPSVIAMNPRRWGFALASLDTQNRPLIVPTAPANPMGSVQGVAAEALVGSMQGLPVINDANIPTTEGAGTNQDTVLIYRAEDIYLWESAPRFRVLEEVLSSKLQVRFQLYGYYAIIAGRYPKAISKVQGTGLVTPSF